MKKRFVSKKKKSNKLFKVILFLVVVYCSFVSFSKVLFNLFLKDQLSNEVIIESLLDRLIVGDNVMMGDVFKINFNNPQTLLDYSLGNLISFGDVDEEVIDDGSYLEDPNPSVILEPLVYIYSTHQSEKYATLTMNEYNIEPNIMMASYLLRELLNDMGVPCIVETTDLVSILHANDWAYSRSYDVSSDYVINAINKYPSIKLIIDLHRDSASKSVTTMEIDGKNYARVLFVVGKEHDNYQVNLDKAYEFSNKFNSLYDGISRGIYLKEGPGVNGIYNQDLSSNSVLLEMGGQYNTIDEVSNTILVTANIIKEMVIDGKDEEV